MKRRKVGKAGMKPARSQVAVKRARPASASSKAKTSASSDLQHQLAEARERLDATSDILRAIAASPGDAEGSLRKIAETTTRLFGAAGASFRVADGDEFKWSVGVGQGAEQIGSSLYSDPALRPTVGGRNLPGTVVRESRQIHLPDLDHLDEEFADWPGPVVARRAGIRTMAGTPLRAGGRAIGALVVYRNVLQPFAPAELQLLQSFADQAAIAIENARLFEAEQERTHELAESLAGQTATSEILRAIAASPSDAQSSLRKIAETTARLFSAVGVSFRIAEGDAFKISLDVGQGAEQVGTSVYTDAPVRPTVGSRNMSGTVVRENRQIHLPDLDNLDAEFADWPGPPVARRVGIRTAVGTPLRSHGRAIGVLIVYRNVLQPFAPAELQLLQSFADQAAIAVENARLFEAERQRTQELTESLEQQTATSQVLQVISSSPGDLQPVFASMLENAVRICDATFGGVYRCDGDMVRLVATHNLPPAFAEVARDAPFRPGPKSFIGRIAASRTLVHLEDAAASQPYIDRDPATVAAVERGGTRAFLAVPMLKENALIGLLYLCRQDVRPYTDKQIELVKNFAAQAVIAIENARLLSELRESLERQTATADVLRVISSSQGELAPVFQAMLENATRICSASFGTLLMYEGDEFRRVARHNMPEVFAADAARHLRPPFDGAPSLRQLISTRRVVHITDMAAEHPEDPIYALGGARSIVVVPMIKDGAIKGCINVYRREVRPFTDKQIELLTNFAAQAVIAIENARLLGELRQRTGDLTESLEQQTATADVLRVISSSPGDLNPVFQAILESATRLCSANFGVFLLLEGEAFRVSAMHNMPDDFAERWRRGPVFRPNRMSPAARSIASRNVVHVLDLRQDEAYRAGDPPLVSLVDTGGARTLLNVPMLKEGVPIGSMTIFRRDVRAFTDKQIDLVKNFVAQAVIAIENTRLLTELRASLEQQTATADVLRVISSSPGDLEPVFNTILQNATRICDASFGNLELSENGAFRLGAMFNAPAGFAEHRAREPLIRPHPLSALARVVETRRFFQIENLPEHPSYKERFAPYVHLVEGAGARTLLVVPLLREDELVGVLGIYRQEVLPFTDDQIALVQNFAAQAVIAIENARLLSELREALEQQTATSDVLKVVSSSPGDLKPVFVSMLENAVRICGATFGTIYRMGPGGLQVVTTQNMPAALAGNRHSSQYSPAAPETPLGDVVATKAVVHVVDMTKHAAYAERRVPALVSGVEVGGVRTWLGVPMVKDDQLIGAFVLYRQEMRPFSEKQIALVTNFANQAVIAIENTRLLSELRELLQQQTATSDVLKTISRSTFDLQTVLQTLVESAARLCDADKATITRQKGDLFYRAESYGFSASFMDSVRDVPVLPERRSASGRALLEGTVVHIPDAHRDPDYQFAEALKHGEFRTILGVPMLREGVPVGVLALTRAEVRPFSDKQIELASTFADQAAIAIENVRLFEAEQRRTRELAKSLEDLHTAQDRLVQTEKLASLGQLTAGIAHEIKNPLNFVNNFSSLSAELIDELTGMLAGVSVDDRTRADITELADMLRGNLEKVVQHGKRADSIVKNMLLHSRQGSGEHQLVDVNALVEESLNLAYHGARAEKQGFNITLERSFDPVAGKADLLPQEITRVLLNLISNGFYAATRRKAETNGGSYEPVLSVATKNLGDRIEIRVRDNGTGIPSEVKEKMFNPFFTTKPAGEGTGLGLSLSHDIVVKQHAGSIEVDTRPGEFTEFRIVLPRGAAAVALAGGKE